MQATKIPRAQLEKQAHEQYVRVLGITAERQRSDRVPDVLNVRETLDRDRPVVVAFRGKPYVVPPIPYDAGLELHDIQMTIARAQLGQAPDTAYRQAMADAVRLMGRLAYRRGRRWLRWLTRNPFRRASEREIVELLDFFWKCRTGMTFRHWTEQIVARATSTGSMGSMSSAAPTDATPRPGVTTSGG